GPVGRDVDIPHVGLEAGVAGVVVFVGAPVGDRGGGGRQVQDRDLIARKSVHAGEVADYDHLRAIGSDVHRHDGECPVAARLGELEAHIGKQSPGVRV